MSMEKKFDEVKLDKEKVKKIVLPVTNFIQTITPGILDQFQ